MFSSQQVNKALRSVNATVFVFFLFIFFSVCVVEINKSDRKAEKKNEQNTDPHFLKATDRETPTCNHFDAGHVASHL